MALEIEASQCRRISLLLIMLFYFGFQEIYAQDKCGAHEIYQEMMENDPVFRKKQEQSKNRSTSRSQVQGLITIPVVFHVVYNNEAENISDEQIYSQIDVLNEDFQNSVSAPAMWHEVAGNPEMEFCLATRDEFGNATCGITRTYTDSTQFEIQTSVKDESTGGVSGWPAREYMNVWICDIASYYGYATFPDAEDSVDGIVIDYLYLGQGEGFTFGDPAFNLGRTGTHEVGHWLRLSHIWGDGNCNIDDGISDTPNAPGPNYGCAVGSPACHPDSLNMVQNYMDYSDDSCMYLFTLEQVDLMRSAFDPQGSRVSILSSKGCDPPAQNEIYFTLTFDEFPEDISWELRDGANNLVAADGNFEPGDPLLGIPSPLANQSLTYELDVPDGDYTLSFYDSFGDGFPEGAYEIRTVFGDVVISGPGTFTDELHIPFTLENSKYRFLGTQSPDWYNPENWNRHAIPSECHADDIIIEADCNVNQLTLDQQITLSIINGAHLTVQE